MHSIQDRARSFNALTFYQQCEPLNGGYSGMAVSHNHLTVEVAGRPGAPPSHSHQRLSSNSNFLGSNDSRLEVTELSGSVSQNGFSMDEESYESKKPFRQALRRDKWKNRTEFILTLIGYTIGLGNVWRFPHLCHKNGGASFLIPYGIMLAIEGIPLYYMELCIGQRMRKGSIGVWNEISPYLGGVGYASVVVCFLVCLYYNVIIAWCVFYFVQSFQSPLPWTSCPMEEKFNGNWTTLNTVETCDVSTPTEYFWYHTTLNITSSIEQTGGMNWKLWGCLVATWVLIWICLMKGIRVTGKIVYLTATLPLVLLIIFFFRGVHLDGYQDGLRLLFVPEFARLTDPLVWLDAAVQIFYSLGVGYGSLIAFSSYNPLKNDSTKDAITVCFINCAVSIYASVVVFCFIGFQAQYRMDDCLAEKHEQIIRLLNDSGLSHHGMPDWEDVDLGIHSDVIVNASKIINETLKVCNKTQFLEMWSGGTGLAFIVFTDVITKMPYAPIWAVMFFLMLICVGIDTQFGMLEGVVTPILDMKILPSWKKKHISGAISFVLCTLGFSMVTFAGPYWFEVIEAYCSGIPLLIISLVECIAISYIYGIERFSEDIQYMTNKPPRFIWKWCWKVISPLAILTVLSMSIKSMSEATPSYSIWDAEKRKSILTPLPAWGVFIAIMLTMSSIFFIPAVAFLKYFGFVPLKSSPLPAVVLSNNTAELQPLYRTSSPRRERKKEPRRAKALRRDPPDHAHNHRPPFNVVANGGLPTAVTANGEISHVMRNHGNGDVRFL